jgi:FlaA1/EpsC-like NDP-sugar epimerase
MTIEEAVGLVLEAVRMSDGSATYVLDMGEPVRIVDLIHNFANLLNIREVDFKYTGLRPGEKLHEELFGAGEEALPTDHPRISMTRPPRAAAGFRAGLRELYDSAGHNRPDEVCRHLRRLVPEYTPAPGLVSAGAPYPDDY